MALRSPRAAAPEGSWEPHGIAPSSPRATVRYNHAVTAIDIRPADIRDRAALVEMHSALNVHARESLVPDDLRPLYAYREFDRVVAQDMISMLGRRDHRVIVAVCDREIVGYVTGRVVSEPQRLLDPKGIMGDWFVRSHARSQGTGRRLVRALLAWFRAEGCQVAESTTLPHNAHARQLHEDLGFHEVEVRYRTRL
jgi:GNAT superfamily N-acetyltransferase